MSKQSFFLKKEPIQKLTKRQGGTVWLKRCEPCMSLVVSLNDKGDLNPAFWRINTAIEETAVLR